MAGFLNAFNKSFQMPDDPQEVDASEQRRYAQMEQEELTRSNGVRFDNATKSVVGDIENATNPSKLLQGLTIPSIAADGSSVDLDVSNLIQEKDGSGWVVGLKNPQTGENTIVTDTADANPNGKVTKFTNEQINNALTNKYNSLSTLSGSLDREMISRMASNLSNEAYGARTMDSRLGYLPGKVDSGTINDTTRNTIQKGTLFNNALQKARDTDDPFAYRGANIASTDELVAYGSGAAGASSDSVSPSQINEQISPEFQSDPSTRRPSERGTEGELDIKEPTYTSFEAGDIEEDYPELKGRPSWKSTFPFVTLKNKLGKKYTPALGVEYVRAINKSGVNTIDLQKSTWLRDNIELVGANLDQIKKWDKDNNQPEGTFLLTLEKMGVAAEEAVLARRDSKKNMTTELREAAYPENVFNVAIMSENVNNNETPDKSIAKVNIENLWKKQNDEDFVTDALKNYDTKAIIDQNGSPNESEIQKRAENATRYAAQLNIDGVNALTKIKRSLSNDAKVHATIIGAAATAALQRNSEGVPTLNKDIFDLLYRKNWNIYTTGDPDISRKDLISKSSSSSKTRRDKNIDSIRTLRGTVDTSLAAANTAREQLTEVDTKGFWFFVKNYATGTDDIKNDANVSKVAAFKSAAAASLENLTRLKEEVRLSGDFPGNNIPDYYRGSIQRIEERVATDLLTAAALSETTGGLAAWVASLGTDEESFDIFNNLNNFVIAVPEDGKITQNTRIIAIGRDGNPSATEFSVKQLGLTLQKGTARRLVRMLVENQKNNQIAQGILDARRKEAPPPLFEDKTSS